MSNLKVDFVEFSKNLQISEVKKNLLKELWKGGDSFPRPWVKSSHLLKISNQKYFDRRLRELRDSEGLDIESKVVDGEHCWRLTSKNIAKGNNRAYLTSSQKLSLFTSGKNKCAVCGRIAESGIRGLQADHKVPLMRGGTNDLVNWQPLCNECNVAKRGACRDCEIDCNSCVWAFPEKIGFNLVIKVPQDLKRLIDQNSCNLKELECYLLDHIKKFAVK